MLVSPLALLTAALALLALLASLVLIVRSRFFRYPLRLIMGLLFFSLFLSLASLGFDLSLYRFFEQNKKIASLQIIGREANRADVLLISHEDMAERLQRFSITGDMVQLDLRVLIWNDWWVWMGMKPVYRLERISGRYDSIEEARNARYSVYSLDTHDVPMEIWRLLKAVGPEIGVRAVYGSGNFVPLVDGARYDVYLGSTGAVHTLPANREAERALQGWD